MLFSRVISQQTIIFLSHKIKNIIGLLVMFIISLSTISLNNSQINISEFSSFLINRYFFSLALIPTIMIISLSSIKYRKNDIFISQTRLVLFVQIIVQTTLINFFLINGYFLFSILEQIFINKGFKINNNLSYELQFPILTWIYIMLSTTTLCILSIIIYSLFNSRIIAFSVGFGINILLFILNVSHHTSIAYDCLTYERPIQFIIGIEILFAILFFLFFILIEILMRKDI